ncbi:MAG: putative Na+/H+ antiporter [Chlamydiales bacterium]|nr:putative Na+/H+ antiporter [Chlamydiales bacterium]
MPLFTLTELAKRPAQFDCLKRPEILQLEGLQFTPFHLVALILFICAVLHTLCVHKIHHWARLLEAKQMPKRGLKESPRSLSVQALYFLAEVEIVFAIWTIPLFIAITVFYGMPIAVSYMNTRDYTEALFVVIILSVASTKPIIHIAEQFIAYLAKQLGGSLSAWWFILLTVGPILGSFITEVGAMVVCALLLSRQFYHYHPSNKLAYATLALLFVNVSVGGLLTNFGSPAVLILAHCWEWTTLDMVLNFGWKAIVGILLSNTLYYLYFRKEFAELNEKHRTSGQWLTGSTKETPYNLPHWVVGAHVFFIVWIVAASHYPAIFFAGFIAFLGFYHSTRHHQHALNLVRPLMVGIFLAGLVIHGGLQGWWVIKLLQGLSPLGVMRTAMTLTAFNDNAAISYLAILVPQWGDVYQYAVFTGVVAGGGLTVIANAPNPAGYVILKPHFSQEIHPIRLFIAALIPTIILYALFYFLGPLFLSN